MHHKLHSLFRIRTYPDYIAAANDLIAIQLIQSFHNRFERREVIMYIRYNADFHNFTCKNKRKISDFIITQIEILLKPF